MTIVDVAEVLGKMKAYKEISAELERLCSENAELRAALREYLFAGIGNSTNFETQANARNMAREVLERTKK